MMSNHSDSHSNLSDVNRPQDPPTLRIRRPVPGSEDLHDDPQTLSFAGLDSDMSVKLPRVQETVGRKFVERFGVEPGFRVLTPGGGPRMLH